MKIIREYICIGSGRVTACYYAVIELDDGSHVELRSPKAKTDEAWLASASLYQAAMAEPEPTIEIEAEDGYVV